MGLFQDMLSDVNKSSNSLKSVKRGHLRHFYASGTNQGPIDNRIEQAMDLVKSHLMNAVRSEVEELKEKIIKLEETISQQQMEISKQHTEFSREVGKLQAENEFLNIQPQQQQQQPQQQQQQYQ